MKKQSVLITIIIVLAITAFAEVFFIVSRNSETVVTSGDETTGLFNDGIICELPTAPERETPNYATHEPENDFIYTEPQTEYDNYAEKYFSDSGKVIKIYSNDNLYEIDTFKYYPDLPYDTEIQHERINQDDYTDYLRELLENNERAEADEKIDLFLLEPEYAAEFLNSDFVLPLSELGITDKELSDQFDYAKDLATDDNGVQKGFMYKLYPEVFIYRKSIAKEVLGTDDPSKIAEYVKDLETFEKTAETMKNSGYYMLGSYQDIYKTFIGNGRIQNVYENGNLVIPEAFIEWAEKTKSYTGNGCIVPDFRITELWSIALENGKVFGHIGNSDYVETWFNQSYDIDYGVWTICPAPVPTYSSGVILCVAKGTDNPEIAAEIMRNIVTDKDELRYIALRESVLTNSVSEMTELYDENGASDFLGGNETLKTYIETAKNIKGAKSNYSINSLIFNFYTYYLNGYLTGEKTYEQALEGFAEKATEYYPEQPKTIAEIEKEQELERNAITAYFTAEEGVTREELKAAGDILLNRLKVKGFTDSECGIDYSSGKITVKLYYPNDFEHASSVIEDIIKPTMEGSEEKLNITIKADDFWFSPQLY
jgi:hypothetical protein